MKDNQFSVFVSGTIKLSWLKDWLVNLINIFKFNLILSDNSNKDHGADVNITDNEGIPLLHQAILRQCTDAALFLLNQDIDINARFFKNLMSSCLPLIEQN